MKTTYNKILFLTLISLITFNAFSQSNNNAFRFRITGNGYSDETIIRLLNGATQNFDGNSDAWKLFSNNPNVPSIYTQISVGQELSINSLPEFTEDNSITIYTSIPTSGSYTINFEEIYGLTSNYKISLSDISSNTHFRLLGDTALTFNCIAQQNSPSFTFNVSTLSTATITDESCFSLNDGALEVNNAGNFDWNIKIVDATNSIIVNSTSNISINKYDFISPGSYTAQINSKGIVDEFNFTISPAVNLTANFNLSSDTIYLSDGGLLNITNTSLNAQSYTWDFGDGNVSIASNPSHNYSITGIYDVSLLSANLNCTAYNTKQITVLSSPSTSTSIQSNESESMSILNLGNGNFQLKAETFDEKRITVYDIKGSKIYYDTTSEKNYDLSLANNLTGIYIIHIVSESGQIIKEKIFR